VPINSPVNGPINAFFKIEIIQKDNYFRQTERQL
jgi:hypothetical protein